LRLCLLHDRFSTKNRHLSARIERPFRANRRHMQRSKRRARLVLFDRRIDAQQKRFRD
jgi:hypothetical protein